MRNELDSTKPLPALAPEYTGPTRLPLRDNPFRTQTTVSMLGMIGSVILCSSLLWGYGAAIYTDHKQEAFAKMQKHLEEKEALNFSKEREAFYAYQLQEQMKRDAALAARAGQAASAGQLTMAGHTRGQPDSPAVPGSQSYAAPRKSSDIITVKDEKGMLLDGRPAVQVSNRHCLSLPSMNLANHNGHEYVQAKCD